MACRYTYQGKTYEAHEFDDLLRAMPIAEASKYMPGVRSLPAAPFIDDTTKWLNLTLKRVIKMAVDEGYDAVAFVNGEQSADRYDLSQQVERIAVLKFDGGKGGYLLDITTKQQGGRQITVDDDEKLADTVGKEMAQKIIDNPKGRQVYAGLDLKVGGEGMKAFYDKIVPQAASALVKKMGGEGMAAVAIEQEAWAETQRAGSTMIPPYKTGGKKFLQQPGFLITDSMREKASGPMPLFSRERGEPLPSDPSLTQWARDVIQGKPADPVAPVSERLPHASLRMAGLPKRPVVISRFFTKGHLSSGKHPEITPEVIGKLPAMLANPRIVIKDRAANQAGEMVDRWQILAAERDNLNRPILVALMPEVQDATGKNLDEKDRRYGAALAGRGEALAVNDIRTMFGREDSLNYVLRNLRQGNVVYMPDQEVAQLRRVIGAENPPAGRAGANPAARRTTAVSVAGDKALQQFESGSPKWQAAKLAIDLPFIDQESIRGVVFSRERAAWTDERIDRLLGNYAYTMDDEKTKAYAGFVSPEDYLRATTPASGVARLESENRPLDQDELRGQVQPIMLIGEPTDARTWKTTGHEGRHRMMALRDAGVSRVPVVFQVGYGLKREPMRNVFVTAQRWSGGPEAQSGFIVDDLTPISYKYAKELKETFGGAGDIRFSRERTDTPEFKAWFGNSKVVNDDGTPMVMYHGTTKGDFTVFNRLESTKWRRPSMDTVGSWFSSNPSEDGGAGMYAAGGESTIYPVYLSIQNPKKYRTFQDFLRHMHRAAGRPMPEEAPGRGSTEELRAELKAEGYDGIEFEQTANESLMQDIKEMGAAVDRAKQEEFSVKRADRLPYTQKRERLEQTLKSMRKEMDEFGSSTEFDKQRVFIAFEPEQIKSAIGNDGSFDETDPNILSSAARNWESPGASKFDDMVYKLQNRQVDLLRVQQAIQETGQQISEDSNTYLREELFHGRAAKRTQDFTKRELDPLTKEMAKRGLTIEELDEYLHARHAEEANKLIAERNPDSPLLQDGGSGLDTELAKQYMADLPADKKAHLEAVAAQVDKILAKTRELMVDYELESKETVKGWGEMFKHYVPLMREDDGDAPSRVGNGQGYSIKGREVKSRTGSTKKVVDILANIAMQRERVIVRGEKNRVGQALVNLARENPNKDFWTVDLAPTTPTYDPKKGVVVQRPDPMFKMRPNVLVAKFREEDGSVKEHAVIFNEKDARALRTVEVMKNLEMARLEGLVGASAQVTRYFAAVNTQWNPVFGVVNFIRDFQNVLLNLKSTPLDGKQAQVAKAAWEMTKGIWTNLRTGKADTEAQKLWDEFQEVGGQTGFRQMFADSQDRADDIRATINPDYWMDSKVGKIFTANGVLKVPISRAAKALKSGFQALSDYNETLENSMRLAVYKTAKESGMSREEAASLAKNISVNFNRKGQVAQQAGALYAFFNASAQGTARLGQLLFTMEPGKPSTLRLSRVGKRLVAGGVLLGVMQALALAAAGHGDDDPPQFMRERSIIIPGFDGKYLSIPMPLGLHVIPNLGRVATEWALGGFKDTPQRVVGLMGMMADSFNPIGNAGLSMQTIAPTVFDPLVALTENRDWQGRPIVKESMNKAIPGHALARDTATSWAIAVSKAVNTLTGGNDYVAGAISPSPDAVDYLVGQITGGVGREISKVEQTVKAAITGEELPSYKIPLVGRFGGDTKSQASESTAFYASTKRLNELETEIKGLQKDGKLAEATQLRTSRPDAYLIAQANRAERDIAKLRKEKSELAKANAPREQVRALEERITARMAAFNRAAEALNAAQAK